MELLKLHINHLHYSNLNLDDIPPLILNMLKIISKKQVLNRILFQILDFLFVLFIPLDFQFHPINLLFNLLKFLFCFILLFLFLIILITNLIILLNRLVFIIINLFCNF